MGLGDGDRIDVGLRLEVENMAFADQAEADEADADALFGPRRGDTRRRSKPSRRLLGRMSCG